MQFVYGFGPPMIIETGLRLQLFDRLEDRVMSIEEISAEIGVPERGLQIVMNALVGLALLQKDDAGRYC